MWMEVDEVYNDLEVIGFILFCLSMNICSGSYDVIFFYFEVNFYSLCKSYFCY